LPLYAKILLAIFCLIITYLYMKYPLEMFTLWGLVANPWLDRSSDSSKKITALICRISVVVADIFFILLIIGVID